MKITFNVAGKPQGKARPRVRRDGHTYTEVKTAQYERYVMTCWKCAGAVKLTGAIKATIIASYPIPRSDSRKKRAEKNGKPCKVKPDCDNIAKIILDALNGYAYDDDAQVTELAVEKHYSETGGVYVCLEEEENGNA